MGVGKTQGYIGCKHKKDKSETGKDGDGDGEEVEKDMMGIFFRIKQENPHVPGGDHRGSSVWYRHSRRWKTR